MAAGGIRRCQSKHVTTARRKRHFSRIILASNLCLPLCWDGGNRQKDSTADKRYSHDASGKLTIEKRRSKALVSAQIHVGFPRSSPLLGDLPMPCAYGAKTSRKTHEVDVDGSFPYDLISTRENYYDVFFRKFVTSTMFFLQFPGQHVLCRFFSPAFSPCLPTQRIQQT